MGQQHQTREHRAARRAIDQAQAAGKWLRCVQGMHGSSGDCLHPTRDIAPDQPADVAHDDTGTVIIGVAHRRCNRTDGAQRRRTPRTPKRWVL